MVAAEDRVSGYRGEAAPDLGPQIDSPAPGRPAGLDSWKDLSAWLDVVHPRGLGVMLGVGYAHAAIHFFQHWRDCGFYLVDPYIRQLRSSGRSPEWAWDDPRTDRDLQIMLEYARNDLHEFRDRFSLMRTFSWAFVEFYRKE